MPIQVFKISLLFSHKKKACMAPAPLSLLLVWHRIWDCTLLSILPAPTTFFHGFSHWTSCQWLFRGNWWWWSEKSVSFLFSRSALYCLVIKRMMRTKVLLNWMHGEAQCKSEGVLKPHRLIFGMQNSILAQDFNVTIVGFELGVQKKKFWKICKKISKNLKKKTFQLKLHTSKWASVASVGGLVYYCKLNCSRIRMIS